MNPTVSLGKTYFDRYDLSNNEEIQKLFYNRPSYQVAKGFMNIDEGS